MGREVILFKSEEKKSSAEIAAVLRQIADKVENGSLTLGQDQEAVTVEFPQTMTLEIKVEEEENRTCKRSLEVELEWVVGAEKRSGLVIS